MEDTAKKTFKSGDPDLYTSGHNRAILKAVRCVEEHVSRTQSLDDLVLMVPSVLQICEGFFLNSATRCGSTDSYRLNDPQFRLMHLHPSGSLLWSELPACVVFHESVLTNRNYMRHVVGVKPKWIKKLMPKKDGVDILRLSGRQAEGS